MPKYNKHFDTLEIYKDLDNIYMNNSLNVDYKVKVIYDNILILSKLIGKINH